MERTANEELMDLPCFRIGCIALGAIAKCA